MQVLGMVFFGSVVTAWYAIMYWMGEKTDEQ